MGSFSDLAPRLGTAAVLLVVFAAALWASGPWFTGLIALISGVMIWELARMLSTPQDKAVILGGVAAAALFAAGLLPLGYALPLLCAVPMLGVALVGVHRRLFVSFSAAIVLAGLGLILHLANFGLIWMLWLVAVVVASDVMGYFAGRVIGGPKFWPAVSPKKTWSGTIAGWVGAGIVGAVFMQITGASAQLISISVALAMMAQMGDIAESAVKRKVGVKDSSSLLPGHGGLFDRFDALVGAAVLLFVIESVAAFPPVGTY